jgi:hypothetical protein
MLIEGGEVSIKLLKHITAHKGNRMSDTSLVPLASLFCNLAYTKEYSTFTIKPFVEGRWALNASQGAIIDGATGTVHRGICARPPANSAFTGISGLMDNAFSFCAMRQTFITASCNHSPG